MSWLSRFRVRRQLALPAPAIDPQLPAVAAHNGQVVAVWLEHQDQRPIHLADLPDAYSIFQPAFYCLRLASDQAGRPRRWTTDPEQSTCDDCYGAYQLSGAWARWILRRRARRQKALTAGAGS